MTAAVKLACYQDLLDLPENLVGEILYGSLHTQPRPSLRHGRSAGRLFSDIEREFDPGSGGGRGGWLILIEPELHLGPHVVVPDIAGWRRERLPHLPAEPFLTLAPDWICEILSPGTARKDRGPKMRIYAEQGVAFAWLIDPEARTVETYERTGSRWLQLHVYADADRARIPPFEDFELDLSRLWVD